MKASFLVIAIAASFVNVPTFVHAQGLPIGGPNSAQLVPRNPTSADQIRLLMDNRTCGTATPYVGNPYRISMAANLILVTLGSRQGGPAPGVCPIGLSDEIDIGRLPAGLYNITLVSEPIAGISGPPETLVSNVPFTVSDARQLKAAPFVRLDYSGHWWDPNDSGWGLFIWHDNADNVLAAWFTYGADGKPIWWVFQPTWQTAMSTNTANLVQTSRMPGPTSPPPNPTTLAIVGTASLDFSRVSRDTSESGRITYTIGNGPTLTRTIQRFKP